VSGRHADDESLRSAFQALADSSGECSRDDLDRIWLAVSGELPADERRELVERLATDPACAEAWRVAHELRRNLPTALVHERRPAWRSAPWLAAAAAVLLIAASVVFVSRRDQSGDTTFRDPGRPAIASLVPTDRALPKGAFQLRWSPGPQDSRYQVRVTTEDLRLLTTVADLTRPEVVIDPARLADVPPGSRILWQVEVTLPSGERVSSPTFVARVQ
jgi:hypothetical protein